MSKPTPHTINNDLLAKYFAGEASAAESAMVERWASASEENAGELSRQRMLWEDLGVVMTGEDETPHSFDVDRAWAGVRSKKMASHTAPVGWTTWMLRIAATLVVASGIAFLVNNYLRETPLMEVATQAEIRNVDLADGSQITLNKESSISYPEQFATDIREVNLKGEAFFEVQPDEQKPFVIHAGPAVVTVLGTSFNVRTSVREDTVTVVVETGRVLFAAGDGEVTLAKGEKATYILNSGLLASTSKITSTGVDQFWRTKKLAFSGHSLPEVVAAIEAAYFVDIELANDSLASCSLTVNFEGDSLDNILDVIALTLDLKVTRSGNVILLNGSGCAEN